MIREVDVRIIALAERPNIGDEGFAEIVAGGIATSVGYALAPFYVVVGVGTGPVAAYAVGAVAREGVFGGVAGNYGRGIEV